MRNQVHDIDKKETHFDEENRADLRTDLWRDLRRDTIPFVDKIGFEKGEILGDTTIVLSALLVFFGVRSYRENVAGGRLTSGAASPSASLLH